LLAERKFPLLSRLLKNHGIPARQKYPTHLFSIIQTLLVAQTFLSVSSSKDCQQVLFAAVKGFCPIAKLYALRKVLLQNVGKDPRFPQKSPHVGRGHNELLRKGNVFFSRLRNECCTAAWPRVGFSRFRSLVARVTVSDPNTKTRSMTNRMQPNDVSSVRLRLPLIWQTC